MQKLKVMTILGTRPEIIRLSAVIKACDCYFDHLLVHTGQNWDFNLSDIFFSELGLRKPNYYLGVAGKNLGETLGGIISKSYDILQTEKPQALLVLGDTNSALSALPAKRLKIPIFHMEAGNRCFDQNVPEEINRKLVDHLSDINLPYTEHSRRYLLSEGFRKEHIFVTGSPLPEVLSTYKEQIENSTILEELGLQKGHYILLSAHREENLDLDGRFQALIASLNQVAEFYQRPILYSTHPRAEKKIREKGIQFHPLVKMHTPFGFFSYNKLQKNSFCVLSDSGTLSEESALLNFPAVLIRDSTERPEVIDKGTLVIGGVKPNQMLQSIEMSRNLYEESLKNGSSAPLPPDYQDVHISIKVVKIIQSYTPIINQVIWHKSNDLTF